MNYYRHSLDGETHQEPGGGVRSRSHGLERGDLGCKARCSPLEPRNLGQRKCRPGWEFLWLLAVFSTLGSFPRGGEVVLQADGPPIRAVSSVRIRQVSRRRTAHDKDLLLSPSGALCRQQLMSE